MDSPPSYSLSIASCGPLSDIGSSGIGGSISSDSVRAHFMAAETQESDMEGKSLSQDSLACCSDGGMCGENFNTLKKGPMWSEVISAATAIVQAAVGDVAIKPPPEFQDSPSSPSSNAGVHTTDANDLIRRRRVMAEWSPNVHEFAENLVEIIIERALVAASKRSACQNSKEFKDCPSKATPISNVSDNADIATTAGNTSTKKRVKNSAKIWMSDFLTASNSASSSSAATAATTFQGSTTITITPFSTLKRPSSRSSLASLTRLSSSHNSLNTAGTGTGTSNNKADDSSFITLAMSHDILTTTSHHTITDMYNVPFDSDIYTVPVDMVRPFHNELIRTAPQRPKRYKHHRRRRRNTTVSNNLCQHNFLIDCTQQRHHCSSGGSVSGLSVSSCNKQRQSAKSQKLMTEVCCANANVITGSNGKRHSAPSTSIAGAIIKPTIIQHHITTTTTTTKSSSRSINNNSQHVKSAGEPIHMTLHEVRQYLQTLYSSSPRKQNDDSSVVESKYNRDKISNLPYQHQNVAHQSSMIHLTSALPKVLVLNNNNKYSSIQTESTTATLSGNGTMLHNNNNNNNNNNFINNSSNNSNNANAKKFKKNSLTSLKPKKFNKDNNDKEITDTANSVPLSSQLDSNNGSGATSNSTSKEKIKKSQRNFSLSLKQTLCNIFRFNSKRSLINSPEHCNNSNGKRNNIQQQNDLILQRDENEDDEDIVDFYQRQQQNNNSSGINTSSNDFDSFMVLPLTTISNGSNTGTTVTSTTLATATVTVATNSLQQNATNSQKLPSILRRALPPLPKSSISGATNGITSEKISENGIGCDSSSNVMSPIINPLDSPSNFPQILAMRPNLVGQEEAGALSDGMEDQGGGPTNEDTSMDFAASIEKVKDYGWYWGPISGEAAEKILSNEPDGSFIVRDSSDDHYIFSLSFRLNNCVRHVRIEHDQGNFSFGSCTKFKSHTIVDFIENAVEHSRSGRYLFFLHRRPILGPMRVQLLHPVSRFKQVQSLQHLCRFVILKMVRKDLIPTLPLPRRLIDYLSAPQYYSEQLASDETSQIEQERIESPVSSSTGELEKICFTPQSGLS